MNEEKILPNKYWRKRTADLIIKMVNDLIINNPQGRVDFEEWHEETYGEPYRWED